MKTKYFPFSHLLAALLCFAAAALLNLYAFFLHPGPERNEARVIKQVQSALRKANLDMNRVKPYLATDTLNFHNLLHDKTYFPVFIFKNKQAVFWTDHTFIKDVDFSNFSDTPRVIESFGKFLVTGTSYRGYQIQVYIPLEKQYGITNSYLQAGLNKEIFQNQRFKILIDPTSGYAKVKYKGNYLFSVQPLDENTARSVSNAAIALISLGLVFLIWGLIRISRALLKKRQYLKSTLLLVLPLVAIRLVLLYYNFPFSVLEVEVFDPKLYASSFWSPSIGDLLLNALLWLIFTFHVNHLFRRKKVYNYLKQLGPQTKLLLKVGCALAFYLLLLSLYNVYFNSFSNSRLVMDITQSLEFSVYKVLLYSAFIIHTVIFLVFAHLLMQIFYYLHEGKEQFFWYLLVVLLCIGLIVTGSLLSQVPVVLVGVSLFFYLAVVFSRFKKNISTNPFSNYLFIFWIIAMSAVTGSLAMYQHYLEQLIDYKQKFATNILTERDVQGEYLLQDISSQIQNDRSIQQRISSPFANRDFIQQKITKYYLSGYFDKYETIVRLFDETKQAADEANQDYKLADYRRTYLDGAAKTDQPDLYFIKEGVQPDSRKYIKLLEVTGTDGQVATIVLELSLTKLMPNSVMPELLLDEKSILPMNNRSLSYAIYSGNKLVYPEGDFEYVHYFTLNSFRNEALFRQGLRLAGFHHLAVQDPKGKTVIVSTGQYSVLDVASNYSFLFLLHTLVFLVYMIGFLLMRGGLKLALNTNFSTKIQLFLNFGILIPLLVVSIATASLVTASYKKDLQDTYEKRGRLVQENILNSWSWATYRTNREALREEVGAIAGLSEADINLYDHTGRLITSSQPKIFDAGLLSKYMNPEAFADITERNAQRILLKERTGNIYFNALYLPLPSVHQAGVVDGFIGIPFFDSEKELESKLIQLLTTVMNIFTAMFIVFMVITNWASRALTVPLKLVTQKLKQTTLTGKNEKLEYESADEIGLLVSEYNQMLLKLEESKTELALREKEAAWREMARQVAHEIKNPLTPMKLSLQYLQKAIAEKKDNLEVLISKIAQTLITQIEILSDIATSFSNFTALPELKPEKLNIVSVLRQSIDLHTNPAEVTIITDIPDGTFEVDADENILMRSFNNLLLNALQAIPGGRRPEIKVSMQVTGSHVLISFKDNGSGVPDEIRHKIFVPNFSTKFTGSGIGLAVVKKGIESSGGQIWFESEEGTGTTFYIELPLVQE